MTMNYTSSRIVLVVLLLAGGYRAAMAEDILIGQTADLSSVTSTQTKDFNDGVTLALKLVNARGGIGGRHIKLVTMDDAYGELAATKNAETLVANPNIVALFGTRGSNPTEAVIKVAERERVALIAPVNGADAVRASKFVFPVRASYKSEVDSVLAYFAVVPTRVAVLVQDDKFGQPLFAYITEELKKTQYKNIRLAGAVVFGRKADELSQSTAQILAMKPRAVIALCNPTACSQFLQSLLKQTSAAKDQRPAVAQLSNADMLAQFAELGAEGLVGNPFAQVMPDPRRSGLTIARDFVADVKRDGQGIDINYRSFEGYISALVLVEGLKRAKTLTRQGVKEGMEAIGTVNFHGFTVEFTPTSRTGSTHVELVSLDRYGRVLH